MRRFTDPLAVTKTIHSSSANDLAMVLLKVLDCDSNVC